MHSLRFTVEVQAGHLEAGGEVEIWSSVKFKNPCLVFYSVIHPSDEYVPFEGFVAAYYPGFWAACYLFHSID